MKLAFTKNYEDFLKDNPILKRNKLVVVIKDKIYTVKINSKENFDYYERRKKKCISMEKK